MIKYLDYKIISTYQDIFVFWTFFFGHFENNFRFCPWDSAGWHDLHPLRSWKILLEVSPVELRSPSCVEVSSDRGNFTCRAVTPPEKEVVSTPLKNMLVKMGIFPNFRGENKKYLKPPPRRAGTPQEMNSLFISGYAGSGCSDSKRFSSFFGYPFVKFLWNKIIYIYTWVRVARSWSPPPLKGRNSPWLPWTINTVGQQALFL